MHQILYMLTAVLLLTACSGKAQTSGANKSYIDTACVFGYDWRSISIGFPEDYSVEEDALPDSLIRIDTISQTQFLEYAKRYSSKIKPDTSRITRTDSSFTLREKNFEKTFPANRICECSASTFGGIIVPLNLYIVYTVDMHNELAYASLIDRKTGKGFDVPTCCDPGPQEILISPRDQFLLTYSSSYYECDNSCIYILRIDRNKAKQNYSLGNHLSINLNRLNITQLVWINEKSFAMSVTEQLNPEDAEDQKIRRFLKITF